MSHSFFCEKLKLTYKVTGSPLPTMTRPSFRQLSLWETRTRIKLYVIFIYIILKTSTKNGLCAKELREIFHSVTLFDIIWISQRLRSWFLFVYIT